jgi:hypothetical protein
MGDGMDACKNIPAVLLWNNRPSDASGDVAEDVARGEGKGVKAKTGPFQ